MTRWKTLARRILLDAPPWFRIIEETLQIPDDEGTIVPDFYRVEGPDFTSVVALTPLGEVIMLYGYLHGLRQKAYTLPGGLVEEGERPLQTVQRELREETGHTADDWTLLGQFVLDGNRQYYTGHLFLAQGAIRTQEPTAYDLETRTVETLPLSMVRARWRNGGFATVPMMTAIGLALHHLG